MKYPFKILGFLASTLVAGAVFANANENKTNIFIDLDSNANKAHAQLQYLKDMDVLGVNLKQHWAEVAVTSEELAQLKSKNLSIRKPKKTLSQSSIAIDKYLSPEQVVMKLNDIAIQYPSITRMFSFGNTHEGRVMMAMEISTHTGDESKPVVIFNAMHHAREVMTTEIVMHIAKVLTENYGKDAEVTKWLDQYRIILVPQVNPDGNSFVSSGHNTMWRKNAYAVNGRVYGVDLNRNYPAYWNYCQGSSGSLSNESYRGPAAASEPETQAMMNLTNTYKPVAEISYHSYSELVLYPYGCSNVKNPSKNLFHAIGKEMSANIRDDSNQANTYAVGSIPALLYNADGGDIDWLWKENGVLAFAIEANSSSFHPDYKTWRNVTVERQEGGWKTILRRMSQSGFRAHVQTASPSELTYSLKKIEGSRKIAFDTDAPDRTFNLKSNNGLLYQLTEKGRYEVTFYLKGQLVKSFTVNVDEKLVDLGDVTV